MADEEEVLINGKSVDDLRITDLKHECDKRGLSKTGSKTMIAERLKAVSCTCMRLIKPLFTSASCNPKNRAPMLAIAYHLSVKKMDKPNKFNAMLQLFPLIKHI